MAHLTVLLLLAVWLWQVTSRNSGNSMLLNPMTAPGNLTGPTPMVIQVPNILSAINNPAWNGSSTNESISLQPAQQFLWGSHNNSKQSTVLSMVMYSQEDELIVSMERFAHDLKSVECDENMSLTFKSNLTFGLVQKSWNWVNFNDLRTFVMVANYPGCGKNQSRDPWVVSNVTFDSSSLTVHMGAVLKTWKDVAHTYTLDFGDFTPSTQAEEKRFLDISFDKSFTVDLTSTLPTDIFSITSDNGLRNVSLDINCNDCGTTGDIVFRGHIEASLFDGITVLQLSATPHNISANLNLTFELEGMLNLDIADPLQVNKKLLTIPLPGGGFSIPDLITFGPNAQVSAGIALDSLEGQASIGFGIHASIPDTAVAVIDLHSKQKVDIHGWTPVITVEPLKIEAEIDAEVELYTEIAIAVSLLFFNDDGFQVDLGLRVPDVFVTAETVYDSAGVCSGSNDELGVILDATVGVNLAVEAYAEVDGALDEILNIPLFTDPDIFAFPEICIPFTVEDTNVCPFVPDSDDEEEYEDVEELAGTKRDISAMESTFRRDLGKRQIPWYLRKREPYLQACDPKPGMYPIQLEAYPSPTAIVAATTAVPVMKPGIPGGCTKDLDCSVGKWTLQRIPGTPTAIKEPTWTWAAEHIYEGNWVRDFIDYMDVTHFGQATNPTPTVCPADAVTDFFKTTPTSTLVIPVGNPPSNQISPPQNYTQALMQNLATWNTYQDLMAILPAEQNSKKYVTFSGNKNIYAQFMQTSTCSDSKQSCPANDNHNRFCWLGRMVSLCQYLNDTEIQSRLAATITGIHTVLDAMQADGAVIKPTSSSFTTFRAAHQTWFEEYWNAGIERLQNQTQVNAQWMLSNPQPGDDSVTLQAIVNNPKDARFCYVQPFVYPTT